MIHDLTVGHPVPTLIPDRAAIVVRPLDEAIVARVLAEFPGLGVELHDG